MEGIQGFRNLGIPRVYLEMSQITSPIVLIRHITIELGNHANPSESLGNLGISWRNLRVSQKLIGYYEKCVCKWKQHLDICRRYKKCRYRKVDLIIAVEGENSYHDWFRPCLRDSLDGLISISIQLNKESNKKKSTNVTIKNCKNRWNLPSETSCHY